ncbi:MAG: hypothetical protein P1P84_13470 [Deferrisomatales bacterium]|nr:hypothetical protein [Deferrisomatales bacterium]
MTCSKCGQAYQDEADGLFPRRDDALAPLVEVGALAAKGADPKQLCPGCREEARLFGAAALFGPGGLGD